MYKVPLILLMCFPIVGFAQNKLENKELKKKIETANVKDAADQNQRMYINACECINDIDLNIGDLKIKIEKINACIDEQIQIKAMSESLLNSLSNIQINKDTTIYLASNDDMYDKHYKILEQQLLEKCSQMSTLLTSINEIKDKSVSKKDEALVFYNKALNASANAQDSLAIIYYKMALDVDPTFVFAWDNLGLAYRKIGDYDKAISAYKTSLKLDPTGNMPNQNLAIAYRYNKEYKKAIKCYEQLIKNDDQNTEAYYGLGMVYGVDLLDYEKGLAMFCEALIMYSSQKSPYVHDAEQMISMMYKELKAKGKDAEIKAILNKYNIKFE